jgi:hypothetical protein
MAKNWTMAEAIKAIANQNAEDVKDIYRRFPVAGMLITKVVAGDTKAAFDIIANLPEWATVNKFEKALKADVPEAEEMTEAEDDAEVEDEVAEEKPAPKAKKSEKVEKKVPTKKAEAEASGDSDYASMSGSKLWDLLKKAGKFKDLKAKGFGTKKADILEYLKQYPLGDSESAAEAEVEDDTEVEEASGYDSMTAQELFKECKKRGIDAKPKKPNKYYIDLLNKADAESDTDDDWDAEEVVEEKPKAKPEKKAKAEKKPAKKAEPVEDDDDDEDWDI